MTFQNDNLPGQMGMGKSANMETGAQKVKMYGVAIRTSEIFEGYHKDFAGKMIYAKALRKMPGCIAVHQILNDMYIAFIFRDPSKRGIAFFEACKHFKSARVMKEPVLVDMLVANWHPKRGWGLELEIKGDFREMFDNLRKDALLG